MLATLAAALFGPALATGCVATVQERAPRATYAAGAPPLPLSEARPAPPAPGMLWAGGYWHWAEVQYVWVPGHWESPPEPLAGAHAAPAGEPGR